MDTNRPTGMYSPPPPPPPPMIAPAGMLGSKIPASVAFVIGVLLFFLPFVDIKCNGTSLQTITGFQLATGFQMKNNTSGNNFFDDIKTDEVDQGITKATTKTEKKEPNMYAMIALGLGVLGLILSFLNAKGAIGIALVTGIGAAGCLIGMMIDIKKQSKLYIPKMSDTGGEFGEGMDKIGRTMNDKLNITIDFTPWFWIAVVAFLAAAFFSYRRMATRT